MAPMKDLFSLSILLETIYFIKTQKIVSLEMDYLLIIGLCAIGRRLLLFGHDTNMTNHELVDHLHYSKWTL